eukprot:7551211-Pyramimonas_sp.AAC.1
MSNSSSALSMMVKRDGWWTSMGMGMYISPSTEWIAARWYVQARPRVAARQRALRVRRWADRLTDHEC